MLARAHGVGHAAQPRGGRGAVEPQRLVGGQTAAAQNPVAEQVEGGAHQKNRNGVAAGGSVHLRGQREKAFEARALAVAELVAKIMTQVRPNGAGPRAVARRVRPARCRRSPQGRGRAPRQGRAGAAAPSAPGRPAQAANTNGRPVSARHASPRSSFSTRCRGGVDLEGGVADHQRRVGRGQHLAEHGPHRHELRGDIPVVRAQHARERHRRARAGVDGQPPHLRDRHRREHRHREDRPIRPNRHVGHQAVVAAQVLDGGNETEVDLAGVQARRAHRRQVELHREERTLLGRGRGRAAARSRTTRR